MKETDQWQSCYNDGWQGSIVPEAFSHPAKFSRGLIHRIYRHAKEMGWFKVGDYCLDPFGGVGLGGLDAMSMGLNWIGVELEEKFVSLGQQNIELWNRQLKGWPNLGTARVVQGDSRRLEEVLFNDHNWGRMDLVVSSSPFKEQIGTSSNFVPLATPGNPKYKNRIYLRKSKISQMAEHGHTPGNLANMKEGDIDIVVGSPPYAGSMESDKGGIDWKKAGRLDRTKPSEKRHSVMSNNDPTSYGQSPGQLGSMREGPFDLCVSSPPYEGSLDASAGEKVAFQKTKHGIVRPHYVPNQENLGNQSGDTFWSASKEIISQCYDLLKPNGMSIWVCKDYVRAKKRVPFSDRWLALCESVGFKLVCRHQAMLVKPEGEQETIRGSQYLETERKSFFRRNHETKVKAAKFWPTLDIDIQNEFLDVAKKQVTVNPTEKKILQKAQVLAFKSECLDDRPYQNEIMIQNEDVICMRTKSGVK